MLEREVGCEADKEADVAAERVEVEPVFRWKLYAEAGKEAALVCGKGCPA